MSPHLGRRSATPEPIFNDLGIEESLNRRGMAHVSILSPADVEHLREERLRLCPDDRAGLVVDYMHPDRSIVRELSDVVRSVFLPHIEQWFNDAQIVLTSFVVKYPGHDSAMFLHDDRTFVDEQRHRCVTLWTPLVDVGPEIPNGGLEVVPGSHRLANSWAGSWTPEVFRQYEHDLRAAAVTPALSAGQSLAYDSRLLHMSGPNLSDHPRVAAVCAVAPRGTRLVHVMATGRRHRVVYEVDDSFFTDHHPRDIEQQVPHRYPVIGEYDVDENLAPREVAAVLGHEVEQRVEHLIPYDLRSGSDPDRFGSMGRKVRTAASAVSDLGIIAGDVVGDEPPRVVTIAEQHAHAAVTPVRHRFRTSNWPRTIPDFLHPTFESNDADLVVIDARAHLQIEISSDRWFTTRLRVLDGPTVGAGLRTSTSARALDAGDVLEVLHVENITIWNQGPGALVLLAERSLRHAATIGDVLRRASQVTGTTLPL